MAHFWFVEPARCTPTESAFAQETRKPGSSKSARASLVSGLGDKPLRQSIDRVALTIADDMAIDPQRDTDITVSELISNHTDWRSAFD